ncbi:MAG: RIP metalloprotease RseP [Alphaproteobacteria bacterium]|nr:RIP metalloprotease RseP [Alphaproteobacteria bacterium]MCB9792553.1 RIP metalloprotease RseP [Alphaproteobacteria bacterium]
MEVAIKFLAAVLLVGILIFIHESGHFFFAKVFGVGVKTFSLGFGRRVWGFVRGGTDYRLSLLPIGGYVLMEGADPFMDGGDDDFEPSSPTSFLNKPVWQRLIIVAAGPAFNLMLPIVVFTGLYMSGEPQELAVVGQVHQDTPAAAAGLLPGDKIVSVNGEPIGFWMELERTLRDQPDGAKLDLVVERGDEALDLSLEVDGDRFQKFRKYPAHAQGLRFYWQDTSIGVDDPDSPAARAGLRTFDFITEIGGQPVERYVELSDALEEAKGPVVVAYKRVEGEQIVEGEATLVPDAGWHAPTENRADPSANLWGLHPGDLFVMRVVEDSAAEAAGIEEGDRLLAIDGRTLSTWGEVTDAVDAAQTGEGKGASVRPLELTLVRQGRVIEKTLTPQVVRAPDGIGTYRAMVGIGSGGGSVAPFEAPRRYGLGEAVATAAQDTWDISLQIVEVVGKLITGEAAPSRTLGGPIQIFRDATAAAEAGLFVWAGMMAQLSISLAIVNFLPVPVLDGGQFLFYFVEGIRGRPLSLAVRERAQQIGVLFLVGLMLMVFILDVNRWITS